MELQFLQSQEFGTAIVDCRRTNRLIFYKSPSALIDDEIDNHVQILKMSALSKVEYGQIFGNFAYLSQTLNAKCRNEHPHLEEFLNDLP